MVLVVFLILGVGGLAAAQSGGKAPQSGLPLDEALSFRITDTISGNFSSEDLGLVDILTEMAGDDTATDVYSLAAAGGEHFEISVRSTVAIYLALLSPWGEIVAGDGGNGDQVNCSVNWRPEQAGTYTVIINSFDGELGTYTMTSGPVETGPFVENTDELPALLPGQNVNGTLQAGDLALSSVVLDSSLDLSFTDAFVMELRAGDVIVADVSSPTAIYLALLNPEQSLIAGEGTAGDENDPHLVVQIPESGRYVVVVNSYHGDSTEYQLGVRMGSEAEIRALSLNMPVDRELVPGEAFEGAIQPDDRIYRTYAVDVPEGSEELTIRIRANQDLDLFARHGMQILHSYDEADHRAASVSGDEELRINAGSDPPLRPGRYFVDVVALIPSEERPRATTRPFVITADIVQQSMPSIAEQRPGDSGDLITETFGPPLGSEDPIAARIDPALGLVQVWPVLVPPGAESLSIRTYNATGRLDLAVAPPGMNIPSTTWEYFGLPHRAITARDNEELTIDRSSDPPLRSGLYQIAVFDLYTTGFSDYEMLASTEDELPSWPEPDLDFDPDDLTLLERTQLASVQLSLSLEEGGALTGSGTLVSPQGHILTSHRVVGMCSPTDATASCSGDVYRDSSGEPVPIMVALSSDALGIATQYYFGQVVDSRPDLDLALVRILGDLNGESFDPDDEVPYAAIGLNSSPPSRGLEVQSIGFPSIAGLGGRTTVSTGTGTIVEDTPESLASQVFIVEGAITPAYTGGALVDGEGLMIGITSTALVQYEVGHHTALIRGLVHLPEEWVGELETAGAEIRR